MGSDFSDFRSSSRGSDGFLPASFRDGCMIGIEDYLDAGTAPRRVAGRTFDDFGLHLMEFLVRSDPSAHWSTSISRQESGEE